MKNIEEDGINLQMIFHIIKSFFIIYSYTALKLTIKKLSH